MSHNYMEFINCSLCKEKFKIGDNVEAIFPCYHTFHLECFKKLTEKCTICNKKIRISNNKKISLSFFMS